MTPRIERRLLVIRRRIPAAAVDRYQELWSRLAEIAAASGFHAWRFVAPEDSAHRLEFLEYEAGSDPRDHAEASAVLQRLRDEVAPPRVEEWLEDR